MTKKIKLESGDYVFINWNVIGHLSGWIDLLFKNSRDLKDFGILSPVVMDEQNKVYSLGGYIMPVTIAPVFYGMGEPYYRQYPGTRSVELVPLLCCIISKELIERIGEPEKAGDILKDADYCLRAAEAGFKIYSTDKFSVQFLRPSVSDDKVAAAAKGLELEHAIFKHTWANKIADRFKTPVVYQCSATSPTGFARAAGGYIKGLYENGVKVHYNNIKGIPFQEITIADPIITDAREEVPSMRIPQVVWGQAPLFFKNSGKYRIGHCEFEGEDIPREWIPYCNMMNELWVPTNWDRERFRRAGVNIPIYVFAQGADPNYHHPDMAPMQFDIREPFKFLCVGAWDPRKNLHNLINAFQQEFGKEEGVSLIIKTMDIGLGEPPSKVVKGLKSKKDGAYVHVIESDFSDVEMGTLYTACNAFVLPTHGEGWGLPQIEALMSGLPVITTGWSAPNEILRDEKGEPYEGVHLLPARVVTAKSSYFYLDGNRWAEPDLNALMERMRFVFENYKEEREKALRTSKLIRERYNWKEVCRPIAERFAAIYKELY